MGFAWRGPATGYDQPAQPDRGGAVPHAITIRLKALWGEKP